MANYYGIFFSYGNTVIRLPINPSEVPTAFEGNNETLNVLGLGDVTITRKPKQKVIEFDSYFPARADRSVLTRGGFKEPEFYIQFFEAALKEGRVLTYTPVRKTEDGSAYDVQDYGFKCTVESFSAVEKGGETGDFYYSLTIKEWRDYSPQKVQVREDALVLAPSRAVPADQITIGDVVETVGPPIRGGGNSEDTQSKVGEVVYIDREYDDEAEDNPEFDLYGGRVYVRTHDPELGMDVFVNQNNSQDMQLAPEDMNSGDWYFKSLLIKYRAGIGLNPFDR